MWVVPGNAGSPRECGFYNTYNTYNTYDTYIQYIRENRAASTDLGSLTYNTYNAPKYERPHTIHLVGVRYFS